MGGGGWGECRKGWSGEDECSTSDLYRQEYVNVPGKMRVFLRAAHKLASYPFGYTKKTGGTVAPKAPRCGHTFRATPTHPECTEINHTF